MILLAYDMELSQAGARAFSGWTRFGFFPARALAEQVGIRNAPSLAPPGPGRVVRRAAEPPLTPGDAAVHTPGGLALPAKAWSFLDEVTLLDAGGIRATRRVDPDDWFFRAHFFQDPVMPGSLGGEAFLEALKVFARERFPDLVATHRFEPIAVGRAHAWTYRGQVLPTSREVTVELGAPAIEDGPAPLLVADGVLAVDGLPIYHLRGFGLRLVPAESR
jgi:3-hydroxymyristoyl/3-hydroxydecanoyl-(acyl carrier protein) dehydratase